MYTTNQQNKWYQVFRTINNRGFTFIESLLQFTIFLTIVLFIVPLFSFLNEMKQDFWTVEEMKWEVFLTELEDELKTASDVRVTRSQNAIELTTQNGTIQYEYYQHQLRRKVDGRGHEPVLLPIQTVKFELLDELNMEVVFDNGEIYHHSFSL